MLYLVKNRRSGAIVLATNSIDEARAKLPENSSLYIDYTPGAIRAINGLPPRRPRRAKR